MAIYFISDFHLGEGEPEAERRKVELFRQFIEQAVGDMEHLVVLGDMFDFWFEYRHLIPKRNLHLLFKLSELTSNGTSVSYIAGNHDLWMDDFLEEEMGIELCRDQLVIDTPRGKILAMHGDGVAKSDRGYRLFKRILRSRVNIALYRLLPPALAYNLAHSTSHKSRQRSAHKPVDSFIGEYISFAEEKFAEGFFAFVCGHTHHPEVRKIGENYYVNSGDWIRNFSYIKFDGSKFTLHYMTEQD